MNKEKLRPLYSEFQGYLSQAPMGKAATDVISDKALWDQYNETVKLLAEITGEDYSRFLIQSVRAGGPGDFIFLSTYRQKLGGLISHIHGKYFSDENPPFSGMPSTIITQTQQQKQSTDIQVYLDIQSKIDQALQSAEDGSNEKGFLEKFKSTLSTASNVTDLFKLGLQLAKDYGVGIATLIKLFS